MAAPRNELAVERGRDFGSRFGLRFGCLFEWRCAMELIQIIRWKAVAVIAAIVLFWWAVLELFSGVL